MKVIYNMLAVVVILVAILLIISVFPITNNFKFLMVQSGSMQPVIKTGSVVFVKPVSNYKIRDIITFNDIKETTTHRIHDMEVVSGKLLYITKGDANNRPDKNRVEQQEIVGKVIFSVPFFGYIINTIKKPIGFLIVILIPAIYIIQKEIRKIFRISQAIYFSRIKYK